MYWISYEVNLFEMNILQSLLLAVWSTYFQENLGFIYFHIFAIQLYLYKYI